MKRKHMLSIVSLLALAVICVYVSAANAFPAPQGIPIPQEIPDLPSMLMDNINNANKNVSFEEAKNNYMERVSAGGEPDLYLIEKYVQQNPNDPNGLIMLGRAHLIIGSLWRYDKIAQCFLQASQMGSEEGTVLFYYTMLLDYNAPQHEAFNGLYAMAQKGNPLAAFLMAERLLRGKDSSPLIATIGKNDRENAAAAFYDIVIRANFSDWGKNYADIAKARLQELGRVPDTASQPVMANNTSSTSPSSEGQSSSNNTIRGFDVTYLTEQQKQSVIDELNSLENDAVELLYVNNYNHYLPDDISYTPNETNPTIGDYLWECRTKLVYIGETLNKHFQGIYENKARDPSYFKNLYSKLEKEKVFDWIADVDKRKTAYNKLKGCCDYYAKAAALYYPFADISNSHMQEIVREQIIYDNGKTIGQAIDFILEKPRWRYSHSGIICNAVNKSPIILSRDVNVDGYYESAKGAMVQATLGFTIFQKEGEENHHFEAAPWKEWFDYALR